MRWSCIALVIALVGCGRFGFAPWSASDGGDDAGDGGLGDGADASPDAAAGGCGFTRLGLGHQYSCAVHRDGTIYCWGRNNAGQLGDGTLTGHPVPMPVLEGGVASTRWIHIARTDEQTTCAIANDATLWCWGLDSHGLLGGITRSAVPIQIQAMGGGAFDQVVDVQVGEHHACARRAVGTIWCWGWNMEGQLGVPVGGDLTYPVVVIDGAAALKTHQLAVGYAQACVRLSSAIQCWGWNQWGQLGDGGTTSRHMPGPVSEGSGVLANVVDVAVGYLHACAVRTDGKVSCWGTGRQVGNPANGGATSSGAVPVFREDGPLLDGVVEIGAGDQHTCARRDDGTVWCWGTGTTGELGDGQGVSRVGAAPVTLGGLPLTGVNGLAVGNQHTCALRANDVLCWGQAASGELGNGAMPPASLSPVAVVCP